MPTQAKNREPAEILGSYSKTRYNKQLSDIAITVRKHDITNGVPGDLTHCAIGLAATRQARTGEGFPEGLENIQILQVSGAEEGVSTYPELHFAATLNGRVVLGKAVSRDVFALEVASCNDLGNTERLAEKVGRVSREARTVTFTDVRCGRARQGSDLPDDPERAYVRRLSDNAVRGSSTPEESAEYVQEHAATFAVHRGIPPARVNELKTLAVERSLNRSPGKRDRTAEPPSRKPVRKSTNRRWSGQ